ncbi:Peptidyl-prolyl cis-trans isomerase cyp10 [Coemansia sp. RSA 552]|nr:Peptidyl-prolyl cis-trans isomerase cyp10 [Coemansia sp. RSA 552]
MSVTLHTDAGDLKLEVFCDEVPKAAENFLALCASGYYNDTLIHRNIPGFIVQMGDPTGKGKGGESIWGRPFNDEIHAALRHSSRGVVSMANSGPNTNKSQFFIAYARQASLDDKYTVFGRVIDGSDTALAALERLEVSKKHRPLADTRLKTVTVHANPFADPECVI